MKFTHYDNETLAKEIANLIKKYTGLNKLDFAITINLNKIDSDVLNIDSNELSDYAYPRIFDSLTIENFGGGWVTGPDGDPLYRLPIHYRYTHFNGGSNGSDIAVLYINQQQDIIHSDNKLTR